MSSRFTVLLLVHLVGDALLLALLYRWLGVDESDGAHLLRSFALAGVIVLGFAWLHGFAFANFAGLSLRRAAARGAVTLIPFALVCLLAIGVYLLFGWVEDHYAGPAFVIGSFLTLHLRIPVPPKFIQAIFHGVLLVLEWSVAPTLLLLLAGRIAVRSFAGPRVWRRSFLLFALAVPALLFCAIWAPLKLFFWIPGVVWFGGQLASLTVRVGIGYLLFVFCTLFLDFVTASGKPVETQPSTVSLP